MGEYDRAIAAGQRTLTLATTSGAFDVQVAAQTTLGQVYYTGGAFRQALDVARRAMTLLTGRAALCTLRQVSLPAVSSRDNMANCLAELGGFAEGRSVAEDAVRIAEAVEQPFSIAGARCTVGLLSRRQGDLQRAIPALERGLALCQEANIARWVPLIASTLGVAYALSGRTTEALPLLTQTTERVAAGRHGGAEVLTLAELSEALLLVGRVEDASALADQLLALSRTHPGRGYQAQTFRLLGDIARGAALLGRRPSDVVMGAEPSSTRAVEGALW